MKQQKKYYRHLYCFVILAFIWVIFFQGRKENRAQDEILNIEKKALASWCNRDIWGFINLYAENATYFDETTQQKVVGYESIKEYFLPWEGKIYTPKYEMANIDVQVNQNIGVLTYNLYNFNEKGDTTVIWNSSEIYKDIQGEWKIIHSHWSLTKKPDSFMRKKDSVWQTIKDINQLWAFDENLDSLAGYVHEDMVVVNSGSKSRFQGKEKIMESYQKFIDYATVFELEELEPEIKLYNNNSTAIVSYYGNLKYLNPENDTMIFNGKEIYTLIFEKGKWKAVSQAFMSNP